MNNLKKRHSQEKSGAESAGDNLSPRRREHKQKEQQKLQVTGIVNIKSQTQGCVIIDVVLVESSQKVNGAIVFLGKQSLSVRKCKNLPVVELDRTPGWLPRVTK